jgi:hypothetical protein
MRYERLRLATAEFPENFGYSPYLFVLARPRWHTKGQGDADSEATWHLHRAQEHIEEHRRLKREQRTHSILLALLAGALTFVGAIGASPAPYGLESRRKVLFLMYDSHCFCSVFVLVRT